MSPFTVMETMISILHQVFPQEEVERRVRELETNEAVRQEMIMGAYRWVDMYRQSYPELSEFEAECEALSSWREGERRRLELEAGLPPRGSFLRPPADYPGTQKEWEMMVNETLAEILTVAKEGGRNVE